MPAVASELTRELETSETDRVFLHRIDSKLPDSVCRGIMSGLEDMSGVRAAQGRARTHELADRDRPAALRRPTR